MNVGFGGFGFLRQGTWGEVNVTAENKSERDRQVIAAVSLDDEGQLQFGRRLWLPARSRRALQVPLRPLGKLGGASQGLHGYLIDPAGASERRLQEQVALVRVEKDPQVTVFVGSGDDNAPADLLVAMRAGVGLSKHLASSRPERLPLRREVWDAVETAMVTTLGGVRESTSTADAAAPIGPAQLRCLRDWLRAGGRLWIMLDRVDAGVFQNALGDLVQVGVVDRVWMNAVRIENAEANKGSAAAFTSELPIAMLRVQAPGMRTVCTAQGWPAVLRQDVGLGELWISTVDARALLAGVAAGGVDRDSLVQSLGRAFLQPGGADRTDAGPGVTPAGDAMPELLRSQVGQRIVSRGVVGGLLLAMTLALAVGAAVLYRLGRSELVGGLVVVLSLATAGAIVALGVVRHRATPTSLNEARMMYVAPGDAAAVVWATAAIYSPTVQRADISGDALPVAWPQQPPPRGSLQRLLFRGLSGWVWQDMPLAEGTVKTFTQRGVADLAEPIRATLGFDEHGAVGRVVGGPLAASLRDLVLRTGGGVYMAVNPDGRGRFALSPDDVLAPGQFVRDVALSDQQQQRQQVMRTLRRRSTKTGAGGIVGAAWATTPVMLGWSEATEPAGLDLGEEAARSVQTLVSLPVELTPPPPGTRVLVPAPLVSWAPMRGGKGVGITTLYDPANGQWIASSTEATILLRFAPPASVTPLRIESAVLEVRVDALGWRLAVVAPSGATSGRTFRGTSGGGGGGGALPLVELGDFDGNGQLQRITIPGDRLRTDPEGAVIVGFRAVTPPGAGVRDGSTAMWQVRHVGLELHGVVGDAPSQAGDARQEQADHE